MSKKEIYMRKLKILLVMLNDNSSKLHLIYRQFFLLETTQKYIDRKRSTRRRMRNPPAKDN